MPNHPIRHRVVASAALVLCASVAVSLAPTAAFAAEPDGGRTYYSSKTPYVPQGTPADYQAAPPGFEQIYTESVARHGARALSSFKYDSLTTQVWEQARSENALTPLGETLGPEVAELTTANETLGYGNLTGLGATQHHELGERVVERQPGFFAGIVAAGDSIALEGSGEPRAMESGENFAAGLVDADAALAPLLPSEISENTATLYFHKEDINQDYQDYSESPTVTDAVSAIWNQPHSREVSRHVLERIYTSDFVDRLAAGAYHFVDGGKGETTVDNEVDAAMMLYNLYIIAPDMVEEGDWDFDRYIESEDAEWFAYLLDTEDFYSKGPAFAGNDITYRMATPLLQEFFDGIDARANGSSVAATFRFAHAETIIPFAALLGLPGSEQPVTPAAPYTYATNAWRGESVTPMTANVQWDAFRNAAGEVIVRMLYNEKEIPFTSSCTPIADGSHFYAETELERCLLGVQPAGGTDGTDGTDENAEPAAASTAALAETGTDAAGVLALSVVLLLAGASALVLRKRMRATR